MDALFSQLSFLLTSPPGNITYYLVVGFSIAWALQAAIGRYSRRHSMHSRRLVWGLAALLAMRLLLFLATLVAEFSASSLDFLPPADRAINVLSLIIMAWLWAYPEKSRSADGFGFLLCGLAIVLFFASLAGWSGHNSTLFFNATLLGPLWEICALIISGGGILILFSRRPQNWGVGVAALAIQFIGSALTLTFPLLQSNYAAFSRLGQMIAYPMLFTLTQYRHISMSDEDFSSHLSGSLSSGAPSSQISSTIIASLVADFLDMEKSGKGNRYNLLARVAGHIFPKSLVFVLTPADRDKKYSVAGWFGVDLPRSGQPVTLKNIPLIGNALQRGRVLSLPAENASTDLATLKDLIKSDEAFHILATPLQETQPDGKIGILILRNEPRWSGDEQQLLTNMAPLFSQILQQPEEKRYFENEILQSLLTQEEQILGLDKKLSKEELRAALSQMWVQNRQLRQTLAAILKKEPQTFEGFFPSIDALENLSKNLNLAALSHTEAVAALEKAIAQYRLDHETIIQLVNEGRSNLLHPDSKNQLQNILSKFQAQNQGLLSDLKRSLNEAGRMKTILEQTGALKRSDSESTQGSQPTMLEYQSSLAHALAQNEERGKEILRLQHALKELQTTFRTHLTQSEQKAMETRERFVKISSQQVSEIAGAIQELHYPLSTIVDYSDLVLDESVGSLGALQRKFLERIKDAVKQLEEQINKLVQTSVLDSSKISLSADLFDLNLIVESALSAVAASTKDKNIDLKQNIARDLPFVQIDKDASEQILLILLRNAIQATPQDGRVVLNIRLDEENGQQYALIQVTDSGEGILQEDLAQVFSPIYHMSRTPIAGVGETDIGLSVAKTLVDALKGRIWVDSETGKGATYSVLLPLPYSMMLGEQP